MTDYEYLQAVGALTIANINTVADLFPNTPMETIRRDLRALFQRGLIDWVCSEAPGYMLTDQGITAYNAMRPACRNSKSLLKKLISTSGVRTKA